MNQSEHAKVLIQSVREHAIEHYNEDGWDYVVEAFDDAEIIEALTLYGDSELPLTTDEAIKIMADTVGIRNGYRKEIQAEIF